MPSQQGDPSTPKRTRGQPRRVLAEITAAKARFVEAVQTARVSAGTLPPDADRLVKEALGSDGAPGEFDRLAEQVGRGEAPPEELSRQAAALSRLRAYVLPPESLAIEARAACGEMAEWSVPQSVLAEVQQSLGEVARCGSPEELLRARAALKQILESYDYWDWYTDWFFGQMRRVLALLAVGFVVGLGGALAAFAGGHGITGFILSGLAGTMVSVMLKMPSLSVYGEVASFTVKVAARVVGGVAAAAIGAGLLCTGVFNVPLASAGKVVSFPELLGQCTDERCAAFATLTLLALGMVLGFTERALGTFEDAIFGAGRKPAAG